MNNEPSRGLYRKEAVAAHQTDNGFDHILLARPLAMGALTAFFGIVALALVLYAPWGSYTRKAHVTGYLAPNKGLIKVTSPQVGIITHRRVQEGSIVKEGEPLFVVSGERSTLANPTAQATVLAQLAARARHLKRELDDQERIDHLRMKVDEGKLSALEDEISQAQIEFDIQQKRVELATRTLDRFRGLAASRFVSEIQVQQRHEELLEQQAKLESVKRDKMSLERQAAALRGELVTSLPRAANSRSAIERSVLELDQQITELDSKRTFLINAPASGVITAILAEPGQSVTTTAVLLSIIPEGTALEAHLLIPPKSIGFIRPNQHVRLRYDAYPYQRFGSYKGTIREISKTTILPADLPNQLSGREPVYRAIVDLEAQSLNMYGRSAPLQPGMSLGADVTLDERRLIEWAFDPLFSLTGRL